MKYQRRKPAYYRNEKVEESSAPKKPFAKRSGRKIITAIFVISLIFSMTNFGIINRELLKSYITPSSHKSAIKLKFDNIYDRICEYANEFFYVYLRDEKSQFPEAFAGESVKSPAEPESKSDARAVSGKELINQDETAPQDNEGKNVLTENQEIFSNPFLPVRPCDGEISSPFGERVHPLTGEVSVHNGVDIACHEGETVSTVFDGTVEKAAYNEYSGNYVIIRHAQGYTSSYAHLSAILVSEGESIKTGSEIGKAGSTGMATGPHLHFEIRKDGISVDPFEYIMGD